MEPTIDAYLCNDVATQQAIEAGKDIYKEGTLETFGRYSDPLKKVFKAVKLSLSYGKDPHNLHKIPIIMNYGLHGVVEAFLLHVMRMRHEPAVPSKGGSAALCGMRLRYQPTQ